MNILLWVLQALLALLYLAGGSYKAFSFGEVANQMTALPHGSWRALGVVEILGGLLLILPPAVKWRPVLTPLASAILAVETFALAAVYGSYSVSLSASNPLVWAVVMGLIATFIAFGRYVLVLRPGV